MSFDYLQSLLRRQPFEPFAVHQSNGEVHAVRHPEVATLTKTRLVVVDPEADRIMVVSQLHVASVEMLQPTAH